MSILPLLSGSQEILVNTTYSAIDGLPVDYDWSATVADGSGNLYLVGNTENGIQKANILIIKYNSSGTVVWEKQWNGATDGNDYGTAIHYKSGFIYVCGATYNETNQDYDWVVLKINDSNGNLAWQYIYSDAAGGHDIPADLTTDSSDNVIITGARQGTTTLADFCTVKLNSSGTQQWVATYDYNGYYDAAAKVTIIPTINAVMVTGGSGNSWASGDFCTVRYTSAGSQVSTYRTQNSSFSFDQPMDMKRDEANNIYVVGRVGSDSTGFDIKILKMDEDLNLIWTHTRDGYGFDDCANALSIDPFGNINITGYYTNASGKKELCVLQYEPDGTFVWEYLRPSAYLGHSEGKAIDTDAGRVVVTGSYEGEYGPDIITIRLNDEGQQRWVKFFEGGQGSIGSGHHLKINSSGNIFTSGVIVTNGISRYMSAKFVEWERVKIPILDDQGRPDYVSNELLIRFKPSALQTAYLNNTSVIWGEVMDFVNQSAINIINDIIEFDFGRLTCFKVHPNFTSEDTVTISRNGHVVNLPQLYATFCISLGEIEVDTTLIKQLNNLPSIVAFSTFNSYAHLTSDTNDPFYLDGSSAGLIASVDIPDANINIEPAWELESGDSEIIVGVYDSGIHYSHLDMSFGNWQTSSVKSGFDYLSSIPIYLSPNPDDLGHGSAVGGIIAAWRNNEFGIAGIAGGNEGSGGVKIHDMKIFAANPNPPNCQMSNLYIAATIDQVAHAIVEGVMGVGPINEKQDILNHSWGNAPPNSFLREAFNLAYQTEAISVVSSGNGANMFTNPCDFLSFPSSFSDRTVLKVGANDSSGARADFSQCGHNLDLIAPGTHDLYVAVKNNSNEFTSDYQPNPNCPAFPLSGTSFAAPHASGSVALMLSYVKNHYPQPFTFSPEDCENLMQMFATDLIEPPNSPGWDEETGWGRLNIGSVLQNIEYPKFLVTHHEGFYTTNIAEQEGSVMNICIEQSLLSLPVGAAKAKRWKVTASFSHSIPDGYSLITGWPRGSSSDIYGKINQSSGICFPYTCLSCGFLPDVGNPSIELTTLSSSGVTMEGYIYELFDNSMNPVGWWPYGTESLARFAYSLYLSENPARVSEMKNPVIELFPNPAHRTVSVKIESLESAQVTVYVMNLLGEVLKTVYRKSDSVIQISVDDIASGIYMVSVVSDYFNHTKKLIVQHD